MFQECKKLSNTSIQFINFIQPLVVQGQHVILHNNNKTLKHIQTATIAPAIITKKVKKKTKNLIYFCLFFYKNLIVKN